MLARMAAFLFAAVLGVFALAADVRPGPPPSPSKDDCTVDKQCKDGAVCPTLGGTIDKDCADDKAKKSMVLKCQSSNPSVGKAVYCPSSKAACGKSSVAGGGSEDATFVFALGATLLAGGALRRARSRRSPKR
jgi:hypothetical protein